MKVYKLSPDCKIRLDNLLRNELPGLIKKEISNSKIRRLIVAGAVSVNSRQVRIPFYEVFAGSSVTVTVEEEKLFFEKQPDDIKYELTSKDVLYEDEYIIVVNKPARFPSEEGMVASRDNLHAALVRFLFKRQKIEKPNAKNPPYAGIMHRLDRETSGAILYTKQRSVNGAFSGMFESHEFTKHYTALVCGVPEKEKFSVEFYMNRISPKGQAAKWGRVSEDKGLYSKTDFEVLKSFTLKDELKKKGITAVLCKLYTGRTHQIRVHLSSAGLPILGDELYGGREWERVMLHASYLEFCHPVTKKIIKINAPFPDDFAETQA